jgi:hypothetical protein
VNKRIYPILAITLLAAVLIACEGGTSGSIVGGRESCTHRGSSGVCDGTWKKLAGTYGKDVENESISSGDAVDVQVQVSVESGKVRVSLQSPDGEESSVEVEPGKAATLSGMAEGSFEEFEVRFEAVEGEASGVAYTISYQVP